MKRYKITYQIITNSMRGEIKDVQLLAGSVKSARREAKIRINEQQGIMRGEKLIIQNTIQI